MFPVQYILETPTLENAIIRVEMQFILDDVEIVRTQVRGNGRFGIVTESATYVYEWSHISGTHLIHTEDNTAATVAAL